jgi:hypothetical protein
MASRVETVRHVTFERSHVAQKTCLHSSSSFVCYPLHPHSFAAFQPPPSCTTLRHRHNISRLYRIARHQQHAQSWHPRAPQLKTLTSLLPHSRQASALTSHLVCFPPRASRCAIVLTTCSIGAASASRAKDESPTFNGMKAYIQAAEKIERCLEEVKRELTTALAADLAAERGDNDRGL